MRSAASLRTNCPRAWLSTWSMAPLKTTMPSTSGGKGGSGKRFSSGAASQAPIGSAAMARRPQPPHGFGLGVGLALAERLSLLTPIAKEWAGLVVYWALGRTDALLPGPR